MVEWLRECGNDPNYGDFIIVCRTDRKNDTIHEVTTYNDAKMIIIKTNTPEECKNIQVYLPGNKYHQNGLKRTSISHFMKRVDGIGYWKQDFSNSEELPIDYNVNTDIENTLKLIEM